MSNHIPTGIEYLRIGMDYLNIPPERLPDVMTLFTDLADIAFNQTMEPIEANEAAQDLAAKIATKQEIAMAVHPAKGKPKLRIVRR